MEPWVDSWPAADSDGRSSPEPINGLRRWVTWLAIIVVVHQAGSLRMGGAGGAREEALRLLRVAPIIRYRVLFWPEIDARHMCHRRTEEESEEEGGDSGRGEARVIRPLLPTWVRRSCTPLSPAHFECIRSAPALPANYLWPLSMALTTALITADERRPLSAYSRHCIVQIGMLEADWLLCWLT
ncbi:hypothetical protein Q1695_003382 [Nippostrongylus brasiliensis]|nr:hypothetical protein Q1695_003382 [Nippostrongylus brasiliensis]